MHRQENDLMKIKSIAATVGASVLATALSPLALADTNPFALTEMSSGYQLADHHEGAEGKCGEGKCGEGKTAAEGKCGEGKCGEKKPAEGKCGEGKCGEKKPEST
jgi:uncharacterized low-complexity protein